mgnify:CR=1 FL=1
MPCILEGGIVEIEQHTSENTSQFLFLFLLLSLIAYLELINILLDLCCKHSVFPLGFQTIRPGYNEILKLKCATPKMGVQRDQHLKNPVPPT